MDISSSTVMGLLTWPEMAKSFVPALPLLQRAVCALCVRAPSVPGKQGVRREAPQTHRPKPANHAGPRRRMVGETATVSTFVTVWRWEQGRKGGGQAP